MSSVSLEQAITPSRAAVEAITKGSEGKNSTRDIKLPDYIAPPPKNSQERREWELHSSRMEVFHNSFRRHFKRLYKLADGTFEKHGMDVLGFMDDTESFLEHLETHHSIEERYMFPVLVKRMPQFREAHQEEHDAIHEGMHKFETLIAKYRNSPSSYAPDEFRQHLASWGPILFYHLDAEVESISPAMLRRYYTLDEVKPLF
ncbi:hypothetical protein JCM8097_005874 [Rhodosporidiobolus ruineniae]